jgi:hypothetical protein
MAAKIAGKMQAVHRDRQHAFDLDGWLALVVGKRFESITPTRAVQMCGGRLDLKASPQAG